MSAWMTLGALGALAAGQYAGVCQGINDPPSISAPPCTGSDVEWNERDAIILVQGNVRCTLSDLATLVPETALARVPGTPATWVLNATLALGGGARLEVHGTAAQGDVDELRLRSTARGFSSVTADWGTLDLLHTRVTSWDEAAQGPDTNVRDGRAFLAVHSYLDRGVPRESRLDIRESDVGFLGYQGASAYGLVWRVDGTGSSGSNSQVFDKVQVYGVIQGSRIHDNYMGSYAWGGFCMEWVGNDVGHNLAYGLDPQDNSDHLLIAGNHVHHNGRHGIICSRNCDHVYIRDNTVNLNVQNGIMLHKNAVASVVERNRVFDNGAAGISLYGSYGNTVRDNDVYRNQDGVYLYQRSRYNTLEQNVVHDNLGVGIRFSNDARGNEVGGNAVFGNGRSGLQDPAAADQLVYGSNTADRLPGHDHPASPEPRPTAGGSQEAP